MRSRARRRELSPLATRSYPARRARPEADCGLRTPFQRDRDRIVHCKAFRRLKHKTQVFVAPERRPLPHAADAHAGGDAGLAHGRARAGAQRGPGRGDRARPRPRPPAVRPHRRGGAGPLPARALRRRAFCHHEHSLRVVDTLERDGQGLNLTEPVRDGIVSHSGRAAEPATLEGRIVRLVDRVAYINHDIDDARAGRRARRPPTCPASAIAILGDTGQRRIDTLVHDLVEHSDARPATSSRASGSAPR